MVHTAGLSCRKWGGFPEKPRSLNSTWRICGVRCHAIGGDKIHFVSQCTTLSIPTERTASMRIAQVPPLTEAIPPKLYGGTERVVHWLTEELVALGHDVTLFASGDSRTSGTLEPMWPKALRLDGSIRDPNALHMMMLESVRQ